MKRKLGHYDIETGEVFEHLNVVAVSPRKRNGFGMAWLALPQDTDEKVDGLGWEGMRVLLHLFRVMKYENHVADRKADMARAIGISRTSFQRAFKKLEDRNLVVPAEPKGTYMVSPEIAWRGSGKNHIVALAKFRKEKLSG